MPESQTDYRWRQRPVPPVTDPACDGLGRLRGEEAAEPGVALPSRYARAANDDDVAPVALIQAVHDAQLYGVLGCGRCLQRV